jgi:hypothetical protein
MRFNPQPKPEKTPKKTKQPLKRSKKRIKSRSDKRVEEDEIYKQLRIEFLSREENRYCPITGELATEIHHTYSGKDRAKYYLDTSTWIAVSRNGHIWIHANPKEARKLGYLK